MVAGDGEIVGDLIFFFLIKKKFFFLYFLFLTMKIRKVSILLREMFTKGQLPLWIPQLEKAGALKEEGGVSSHDGWSELCPPEGARCTQHKASCSIL